MSDHNPRTNGEPLDEPTDEPSDDLAEFVTSRPDGLDPDDVTDRVDVDEKLRKQARYESIQAARSHAAEQIQDARLLRMQARDSGLDSDEADAFAASRIHDAVLRYVLELEPYLTSLPVGRHYWEGMELGTVQFDVLEATRSPAGLGRGTERVERRQPDPVTLIGLCDFVEAPGRFVRTLEVEGGGHDRVERPMPGEVSRRAFRGCNQFASDVGLDIDPDTDEEPKHLDW